MRKKPKQERSRETVRIIIEAATQILSQEGPDALTTNRVAAIAGVSIGSVYQYFPNKQAIVIAVVDRQIEGFEENIQQLIRSSDDIPTEMFISGMVRGLFALRGQYGLLMSLHDQALRLPGAMNRRIDLAERVRPVIRRMLQRRTRDLRPMDPDLVAFVVVHAIQGSMVALDGGVEPWFSDQEELIEELTLLLNRYLLPPQTSAPKNPKNQA